VTGALAVSLCQSLPLSGSQSATGPEQRLTENMAGPFCTMILADLGAEIVKLERPGKGDAVRAWGDGSERNPYFRYINRNKKGITLDYKQPEGRALFLRLVQGMDVLVENYWPTVMPRAGLGFEALHEVNPRLIYAQLSGLGYDGPYAGRGPAST
jgi:crotonobetainyl-CoA:carnitine CoA-transferase CaiB-like acyl-CoA transferase